LKKIVLLILFFLFFKVGFSQLGRLYIGYPVLFHPQLTGIFDLTYQNNILSDLNYRKSLTFRTSYRLYKKDVEFQNRASVGLFRDEILFLTPGISSIYYFGVQYNYTWEKSQTANNHGYSIILGSNFRFSKKIEPYIQLELQRFNTDFLFCTTIGISRTFRKK
jgi:hypothetical protein